LQETLHVARAESNPEEIALEDPKEGLRSNPEELDIDEVPDDEDGDASIFTAVQIHNAAVGAGRDREEVPLPRV